MSFTYGTFDWTVFGFSPRTLKIEKEFKILVPGVVSFPIAVVEVESILVVVFDKGKVDCIGTADCSDCDLLVHLKWGSSVLFLHPSPVGCRI